MIQALKVESPGLASEAFNNHPNNTRDFHISEASSKDIAGLKARMALAGHCVYDGGNNDFIVVKADWCMSRHCPDWSALQRFARVLGVVHG